MHEGDRTIKGHRRISNILKGISVVESVRIRVIGILSRRSSQGKARSVLGNTIYVAMIRKCDVQ